MAVLVAPAERFPVTVVPVVPAVLVVLVVPVVMVVMALPLLLLVSRDQPVATPVLVEEAAVVVAAVMRARPAGRVVRVSMAMVVRAVLVVMPVTQAMAVGVMTVLASSIPMAQMVVPAATRACVVSAEPGDKPVSAAPAALSVNRALPVLRDSVVRVPMVAMAGIRTFRVLTAARAVTVVMRVLVVMPGTVVAAATAERPETEVREATEGVAVLGEVPAGTVEPEDPEAPSLAPAVQVEREVSVATRTTARSAAMVVLAVLAAMP